jgi:hypothetical protein
LYPILISPCAQAGTSAEPMQTANATAQARFVNHADIVVSPAPRFRNATMDVLSRRGIKKNSRGAELLWCLG